MHAQLYQQTDIEEHIYQMMIINRCQFEVYLHVFHFLSYFETENLLHFKSATTNDLPSLNVKLHSGGKIRICEKVDSKHSFWV